MKNRVQIKAESLELATRISDLRRARQEAIAKFDAEIHASEAEYDRLLDALQSPGGPPTSMPVRQEVPGKNFSGTLQERILSVLKHAERPLTADRIALELAENKEKVQWALYTLKSAKKLVRQPSRGLWELNR